MSRPPVICPSEDRRLYEVVEPFTVRHALLAGGELTIPAGFLFDGLSVPKRLWDIVPPGAPWGLRAAAVHDWLCDHQVGRAYDAAQIFHHFLAEDGTKAGQSRFLLAMMREAVEHLGPQFGNRPPRRGRRAGDSARR